MNNFRVFFRQSHPIFQLLILVGITLFTAGLMAGLSVLVTEALFNASWDQVQKLLETPETPGATAVLKTLQMFTTMGMFVLPAMIFAQLSAADPAKYLRLSRQVSWQKLAAATVLFVAFIPITDALGWLNNLAHLPEMWQTAEAEMRQASAENSRLLSSFLAMNSWGDFAFNLFLMAALPAIGEEFFFRGIILRLLQQRTGRVHLSVWVTALAFGLMHGQIFALLPLMVLGALLGYLKLWTNNLWVPILAHFVNNATIVVVMFFSDINMSDATEMTSPEWIYLIPAVAASAALIYYFIKTKVAPETFETPIADNSGAED